MSTSLNAVVDRRAAFAGIAAAAASTVAFLPLIANADGAVSAATIARSRGIYGDRIAKLKAAVDKGDFDTVASEKAAFILFNSGAYPRVVDKSEKAAAIAATNDIFAAIRSQDSSKLKSAYSKYVADNGIKPIPKIDTSYGQGYSGDYDWKVGTPAA
jgi:hypothetical protein